jgi:hypothetical protein
MKKHHHITLLVIGSLLLFSCSDRSIKPILYINMREETTIIIHQHSDSKSDVGAK